MPTNGQGQFDHIPLIDLAPLLEGGEAACVTPERPAQFAPLVYGDFLMGVLRANHDQHQQRPPAARPSA
jgi:hypothetical protein